MQTYYTGCSMARKLKIPFPNDRVKSALVTTTGVLLRPGKSPDESLGQLFADVQIQGIFPDGMIFVNFIPRVRPSIIRRAYEREKQQPGFDMRAFIAKYFYEPAPRPDVAVDSSVERTAREHITELWPVLERRNHRDKASLVALPYPYIVPGGRFSEQFYWDSYFVMLGLAADGRWDMVEGIVKNAAYMIRKFGYVPTANRTYFLSRSQPPFFVHMVRLLARHKGHRSTMMEYLPQMLAEYRFWTKGRRKVGGHVDARAFSRVVQMPNGALLNRYFDNKTTPRPESLREDIETAEQAGVHDSDRLYLDLRAGAESGWDFSSRWFTDALEISSIHTTDIVPIDLNSLLYQLEMTIAETYRHMYQPLLAKRFRTLAERRAATISRHMWSESEQFFMDYDFRAGKQTPRVTLAGVFPLFAKIASAQQAAAVAGRLERDFLKPGGLVTTLVETGQQWDAPNGWAPLQWIAIQGLREYGYHALANEIKSRWIATCAHTFATSGKMVEKYDVVDPTRPGGGGEYQLQDGFGWTNGVLAALLDEDMPH